MAITAVILDTDFRPGQVQPSSPSSQASMPHSIRCMPGGSSEYASEVINGNGIAPPARTDGGWVMRALLKPGDPPPIPSTMRAEWHHGDHFAVNQHVRLLNSVWIPGNGEHEQGDAGSNYRIFTQVHSTSGSPTFGNRMGGSFDGKTGIIYGTHKTVVGTGGSTAWERLLSGYSGRWVDFYHELYVPVSSAGYYRVYADDYETPLWSVEGVDLNIDNTSTWYTKSGLYGHTGLIYFGKWMTVICDSDENVALDLIPPGGTTNPPVEVPADPDAHPVARVARGTAYNGTGGVTTLTIANVEISDGQSLTVEGSATLPATETISSILWGATAMTVHQYENDIASPSMVSFVAELHLEPGEAGGIEDVVITTSDNYSTANAVATEVWDIGESLTVQWDEGEGTEVEGTPVVTGSQPAAMTGCVFVRGALADAAPVMGGAIAVVGQRAGGAPNPSGGNATTNEGFGSQSEAGSRKVLASLPTASRVWTTALVVFPVAPRELPEEWKRYASLSWAIPGVPV